MNIVTWDVKATERIRAWGAPVYGFWHAIASYGIAVYGFCLGIFTFAGWIEHWSHVLGLTFLTYVLAISIQAIIRRKRPQLSQPLPYQLWWKTYSLPSGHAATSATLTSSLLLLTTFPSAALQVLCIVAFIITALLIGISRLVVGVHYLFDVFLGFALGIFVVAWYAQEFLH